MLRAVLRDHTALNYFKKKEGIMRKFGEIKNI
jgi:hypothetical protein